ncbi:unnamed protein product [Closterium sp. Yama58-4]|nr:unnamed protein product [Closterium sp. Yama58-4]
MEIGPQKLAAAAAVGSVAASVRVVECRGVEGGEEDEEGVKGVMDVGGSRGEGGVGGEEREDAGEGQMGAAGATGCAEEATVGAAGAMESGEAAEMLGVAGHVGGVGSTAEDGSHVECNQNEPGVAPVSGRARDGAVCVGVREKAGVGVMGGGRGSGEGGEEEAVGVRVERSGGECAAAEGNVGSEQTGQLGSPLDEGRQSEAAVAPVPVASSASDLMGGPREEVAAVVGAAVTGELGLEVLGNESEAHPAAAAAAAAAVAAAAAAAAAVGGASGGSGGISVAEIRVGEGAGPMGVKGESGGVNRVLGAVGVEGSEARISEVAEVAEGRAQQHMCGMGGEEETAEMRKQVAAMRMGMVLWRKPPSKWKPTLPS